MTIFSKINEFAFISLIAFNKYSKTLYFIHLPLAYIWNSLIRLPLTTSVFFIVQPLTIINLPIWPLESSFTVFLVVWVISKEEWAIRIYLKPLSFFKTMTKSSFKQFSWEIKYCAKTMGLILLIGLAKICTLINFKDLKIFLIESEIVRKEII